MSEADREFGGYFEFEAASGSLFHDKALRLNTARNALAWLIERRRIRKIWLPDYICDSVLDACSRMHAEVEFYQLDAALRPMSLPDLGPDDWFYLVNYFGTLDSAEMQDIHHQLDRVIVDNVQAYFARPVRGADSIYSCRKFFGVPDGAFLYTDVNAEPPAGIGVSAAWLGQVMGRFESTGAAHFNEHRDNEARLDDEPISRMSRVTENLLRSIDYEKSATQRWENFRALEQRLSSLNEWTPTMFSTPFAYPLLVADGATIRAKLQAKRVYVPLLWPNVLDALPTDRFAHRLARDLLPIPLDHRYTTDDMNIIADFVEEVLEG